MFAFFRKQSELPGNRIVAAASGRIIPLDTVKDEAFASKMLGDGAAIVPDSEYIVAPCRGKITMLYPTLHAFGITGDDGIPVLVHIGIDTVRLNGKGFHAFVKEGDEVEAGDRIIRFDSYRMKQENLDMTVMTLLPQEDGRKYEIVRSGYAQKGKTPVAVYETVL